ncbi:CLUMA_CG001501, isoform A [Clunio marinus]|uniref:CLUMA_CG001501, isoform A n=1 Tax=Clunio marinus TaxID=568069 RepID=A0A1J1HI46_9DIPT|nr:CLUMA_CG001501, isoform A [Clunio marinus]
MEACADVISAISEWRSSLITVLECGKAAKIFHFSKAFKMKKLISTHTYLKLTNTSKDGEVKLCGAGKIQHRSHTINIIDRDENRI